MNNENENNNNNYDSNSEENRKANRLCLISITCTFMSFIFDNIHIIAFPILDTLFSLSGFILMIIVRVLYPKNLFGKVLMWIYIIFFILFVILFFSIIITCGQACPDCVESLRSL